MKQLLSGLVLSVLLASSPALAQEEGSRIFDRVSKTRIIRCGYFISVPYVMKNPKTGKMGGIVADYLHEVAELNRFKILWGKMIDPADAEMALNRGDFDVLCTPLTRTVANENRYAFLGEFGKTSYYLYASNGNKLKLNGKKIPRIVAREGTVIEEDIRRYVPKGKIQFLPSTTTPFSLLDYARYLKAEGVVTDEISARLYTEKHPNLLYMPIETPLYEQPISIAVSKKDRLWYEFTQGIFGTNMQDNNQRIAKHIKAYQ